jgi:hypothetical protein
MFVGASEERFSAARLARDYLGLYGAIAHRALPSFGENNGPNVISLPRHDGTRHRAAHARSDLNSLSQMVTSTRE